MLIKSIKFYYLLSAFYLISSFCSGQGIGIGQWRDHLPYNSCVAVAEAGNKIYCATKYCLFEYDKNDRSVTRINKINGLSDFGVSTIKYDSKYKILIIAYTNTNIDIIDDNGSITNISDIKRKQILGSKTINRISFIGDYAYLSCSFGIIVFDPAHLQIKDTYYIGPGGSTINVNDVTSDGEYIYAATDKGIYTVSAASPNPADYNEWSRLQNIPGPNKKYSLLTYFNNKIYANQVNLFYDTAQKKYIRSDTIYSYDINDRKVFSNYPRVQINSFEISYGQLVVCTSGFADVYGADEQIKMHIYSYNIPDWISPSDAITDANNNVWIADQNVGLAKITEEYACEVIAPNGPATNNVFSMSYGGNHLWVTSGGIKSNWDNLWTNNGIYVYDYRKSQWSSFTAYNTSALENVGDYISAGIDPLNSNDAYIGTWSLGMIKFKQFAENNYEFSQYYNAGNSSLKPFALGSYSVLRVGGICFDADDNMWVTNPGSYSPLSVKMAGDNGEWYSFHFSGINTTTFLSNIVIDSYNQKWAVLPRGEGVLVFNDNYTISNVYDDQYKKLSNVAGNGNLPSSNVLSIANDLSGEIWIGTDQGVAVVYSPGDIFTGNDWDAQQILVQQDGHWQYLLYTESVTAIAVDGANRKWFGTLNSGVYLMSADGTTLIQHFTEDNSPLLSNTITSIAINNETGEVFFGTNNGIISYKSDATGGKDDFSDKKSVYAYPNPVKHDYRGPIAIKGLVTNADVKITGISGNLVYSTTALGGQAIWNGKNFEGEQVHTGVYLVYCTNDDGSQTMVTKILVIK
jgi:hypothetical protein